MLNTEMPAVLTIGHSTRTWKDFLELLRAHRVKRVIDVRTIPRSRHNPQFNRETLSTKLRAAKIGYVHLRKLGGLRHARRDSPNMGWRNTSFRGFCRLYADRGIRSRVTPVDHIGGAEAQRDYVCGSGSMALPPFAHRRCADGTRDSGRRHYEREAFPGSFAHSLCTRARSSHHVPCRESRRRASSRQSVFQKVYGRIKNQGLRMW